MELPLSALPTYVTCAKGPKAAAERLAQDTRISGKRPVEILPRDFTTLVTDKDSRTCRWVLHNCLNRPLKGKLTVESPRRSRSRPAARRSVSKPARLRPWSFPVKAASPQESNTYPFEFNFASDAGNADYTGGAQLRRGAQGDDDRRWSS